VKDGSTESLLDIPTTWGVIRVRACGGAVVECRLPIVHRAPATPFRRQGRVRLHAHGADRVVLLQAARFVDACLRGRPAVCPPLVDPAPGPFTRRARTVLREIKMGHTCSYAELAAAAGSPGAARAAGSACATNPLPLFIPCHRVLAAGGKLGGYSGGLAWKRILLLREGVR
jgi:methylated-DNA-[protein]-cysteine S-methyltransferase